MRWRNGSSSNGEDRNTGVGGIVMKGPLQEGLLTSLVNGSVFEDNSASQGAGLEVLSGNVDLTLSYDAFEGNVASKGGAVYCSAEDTPDSMVTKVTMTGEMSFEHNDADDGDDIYNDHSSPCSFTCSKSVKEYCDSSSSSSISESTVILVLGLILGGIIIIILASTYPVA